MIKHLLSLDITIEIVRSLQSSLGYYVKAISVSSQGLNPIQRSSSKEGKDSPIDRKVGFLRFRRCDLHQLSGERQNDQRAHLHRNIGFFHCGKHCPTQQRKKWFSTKITQMLTPWTAAPYVATMETHCRPTENVFFRRFRKILEHRGDYREGWLGTY